MVLLALVFVAEFGQSQSQVNQRCLDCICQSSSNCDLGKRCHTAPNGGYFCGAYQISWPYWADGGRLGDRGRPDDFESCLNNKMCAEDTIRGYMNKWYAIRLKSAKSSFKLTVDCLIGPKIVTAMAGSIASIGRQFTWLVSVLMTILNILKLMTVMFVCRWFKLSTRLASSKPVLESLSTDAMFQRGRRGRVEARWVPAINSRLSLIAIKAESVG